MLWANDNPKASGNRRFGWCWTCKRCLLTCWFPPLRQCRRKRRGNCGDSPQQRVQLAAQDQSETLTETHCTCANFCNDDRTKTLSRICTGTTLHATIPNRHLRIRSFPHFTLSLEVQVYVRTSSIGVSLAANQQIHCDVEMFTEAEQ